MRTRGLIQVLLSGICFGFLGIFGKLSFLKGLSVGELLTYRFSLAALILGLGLAIIRPSWLRIDFKQLGISLALGVFGYAIFSSLYFLSIQGITVGLAALLLFTFPLFVNLGEWLFLKHKLSKPQLISMFLSFLGLCLLVYGDWSIQSRLSVFYGLGAAITYATYVLVSGVVQKQVRPLTSSFYVIVGASAMLGLIHQPSTDIFSLTQVDKWWLILGISIICTIAPITLFLSGLQKMKSSEASLVVMIEPVVATLAGMAFFQESLSFIQSLGAFLILSAIVMKAWKFG